MEIPVASFLFVLFGRYLTLWLIFERRYINFSSVSG